MDYVPEQLITVVAPPILALGTATLLRSIPFIGPVTTLSDTNLTGEQLLGLYARVVVVYPPVLLSFPELNTTFPTTWIALTDDFHPVPPEIPVAVHIYDNTSGLQAALMAALSQQPYRSPRLRAVA